MSEEDASELRKAATVALLRDGAAGLEVLMLRRSAHLAFYGGAWVFPGGRIESSDRKGAAVDELAAAARAAVRETAEEAGLTVAASELACFARWVTPLGHPRRYDTWFFAARAPAGGVEIDRGEVVAHRWLAPEAALSAHARGEIELPPPTFVTLHRLRELASAEAAYRYLARGPVQRYVPRPVPVEGGFVFLYEEDAGYETRDPQAPGPRHRITAIGRPWRYERSR